MTGAQGAGSDQELVQEFSQLIASIAQEVTRTVVRDTALKEVQNLQQSLQELRAGAPGLLKDIGLAERSLNSASQDTQKALTASSRVAQTVLGNLSRQIEQQNQTLALHLQQASKKYDELSTGSYTAYTKAMAGQNKLLEEAIVKAVDTVVAAIVRQGNGDARQLVTTTLQANNSLTELITKQQKKLASDQDANLKLLTHQLIQMEQRWDSKADELSERLLKMETARSAEHKQLLHRVGKLLFLNSLILLGLIGAFCWRYLL